MVDIISTIAIISLNVNGLNVPIKRQRLSEWIQKKDPTIYLLQQFHFKCKGIYRLKVKR